MKYIEITAKTVEEAKLQAEKELQEQGLVYVRAEVLAMPTSGFLGFGKKDAKVRVYYEETTKSEVVTEAVEEVVELPVVEIVEETTEPVTESVEVVNETEPEAIEVLEVVEVQKEKAVLTKEKQSEIAEKAKTFLYEMFAKMSLNVMIEKRITSDRVILQVRGENLGLLIGKHGQTLDAIQYLTNLVANKDEGVHAHIMVDVEEYRTRREATLQDLAKRLADKAKRNRHRVSLEPMNAYERKIIHTALQNVSNIKTYSEGEGSYRHIVIEYVK